SVGVLGLQLLAVGLGLLCLGHLRALELGDLRLELVTLGLEGLALVTLAGEIGEDRLFGASSVRVFSGSVSDLLSAVVWLLALLRGLVLCRVRRCSGRIAARRGGGTVVGAFQCADPRASAVMRHFFLPLVERLRCAVLAPPCGGSRVGTAGRSVVA